MSINSTTCIHLLRKKYKQMKHLFSLLMLVWGIPSVAQNASEFPGFIGANKVKIHSFAAGTKILMGDGPDRNIEDIRKGDIILAYDIKAKRHVLSQVKSVSQKTVGDLVRYVFANEVTTIASKTHPFLLKNLSWASLSPQKSAQHEGYDKVVQIKVGDYVRQLGQVIRITKIIPLNERRITYTIKTSLGDAYFANGCAVGAGRASELLVKKNP